MAMDAAVSSEALSALHIISSHTKLFEKMKTNKGFQLRKVCGENIIVATGVENIDFSSIIRLNESAAYLWEKVGKNDFTADEMANYLTEEYEVDMATAQKDATELAATWLEAGIIEA